MSKITQNYIEARRDGIKWLNSQKRDYSTGVNILTRSGYRGLSPHVWHARAKSRIPARSWSMKSGR